MCKYVKLHLYCFIIPKFGDTFEMFIFMDHKAKKYCVPLACYFVFHFISFVNSLLEPSFRISIFARNIGVITFRI